jgi:Uma2 family endonuclease
MSAVPKSRLTPAEYLAVERKATVKSEYLRGEVFAMAGASPAHNAVNDNLVIEVGSRLKGGPCRTYSSDQRVKVSATGLYTYPDIVIVCGLPDYEDGERDTLLNPQAIIEILSKSTESYDRGAKFRHYQHVESLREYVLVSQDEPVCERFVRQPDGNWLLTTVSGLDKVFEFASIPVRVPLTEIYRDVTFSETPPRSTTTTP